MDFFYYGGYISKLSYALKPEAGVNVAGVELVATARR